MTAAALMVPPPRLSGTGPEGLLPPRAISVASRFFIATRKSVALASPIANRAE